MRKIIAIILVTLFASYISAYADQDVAKEGEDYPDLGKSDSEVIIHLKSGEVIKGILIEKTDDMLVIEKQGNTLSFKLDDIFKLEEDKTGKVFTAGYRLPFSTAIITYEYTGWQRGKETIYIDVDKNKIAIESSTTTSFADLTDKDNQVTIYDGRTIYMVDPEKNEATKMEQKGDIISDMFAEQLYFGRPTTTESFLGKKCKVYQIPAGKAYFWYGILLKQETTTHPMGDGYNFMKEAIDIKLDASIPADRFELKPDIKVKTFAEAFKKIDEYGKEIEEYSLKQYKKDPDMKAILKEATRPDGTIDMEKVESLRKEKRKKEVIERAKRLENGEKLIQKATDADGDIDTSKLTKLIYEAEQLEWYKKDPKMEEFIEKAKRPDGTIDMEKVLQLRAEKEKKELIERAKRLEDGERLIEEATDFNGEINIAKLWELVHHTERLEKLVEKTRSLKDGDKLIQEATSEDGSVDMPKLQQLIWQKEKEQREKKAEISKQYDKLIEAGNFAYSQKKYSTAIDKYTEAIQLDPSDIGGYIHRYQTYEGMGEYKKAIQDLSKLMELQRKMYGENYNHYDNLFQRGDLCMQAGEYQKAIEDYNGCLQLLQSKSTEAVQHQKAILEEIGEDISRIDWSKILGDEFAFILKRRGNAYRKLKRYKEALKDFTDAIEKSVNERRKGYVYFLRGLTYKQMGQTPRMRDDWQKAQSLGDKLEEGIDRLSGRRHGRHIWYYPDGTTKHEGNYVDGEKHDRHIWYYANGKVQAEGSYVDDKQDGEWRWYHEDGKLQRRAIYKNGVVQKN